MLKFIYNKFNQGAYSTTYTSGVGDIVLREMQRIRNGNYVTWVKYDYATGQRPSTYAYNTTNDEKSLKLIQDEESSKTYLITASYLNNDVYSYSYGGPYNITGNFPSVTGQPLSSPQGYLWFFSDLTGITYRRKKPDNSLATGYTATWTYTSSSLVTPGQDEAKSYRVSQSTYTGTGEPTYTVGYTYVQAAANQQRITVTLPGGKVRNYWFHHYTKGINENALHGYLSGIDDSTRSQRFTWQPSVVIGKKPASGTSYEDSAMENVSRLRQSATSITHHGTYGTSILTFDSYDNPLSLTETGINGSSSISRTVTQTYFNADPLQVNQGTDWWILGLKTAVTSNGKSLWQSTYDKQGAMTYKIEKGTRTDFSYTGVSFSSCIPSLASFSWGSFISCVGNYLFGNYHTGLVYEENTGLGLQITKYAAHKKGIAQRIRLPNGAEETNEVDDYGNITNHVNADGIASSSTYDDAGLMTTTTPVMGLASTTISRNGFTVSQVTTAGSTTTLSTTETWSGFGRKLSSASTSGGRTLYIKYEYDASGRLLKETFPSDNSNPTVGLVYGYDVFDRVTSATNGTAVESYCYQSCGSDVGSLVKITNSLGDQVVVKSYYSLGSFSPTLNSRTEQRGTDASSLTTQVNYDPDWLAPVSSKRGKSEQTYIYNASGRLQSISDNASGTITVTYDAAGRVKTRTYPGSLVETIQYQGLGDLVKSRTLSGGAGTMTYAYTNGGRLTKATSPHAILNLSYDAYKRPTQLKQTITLPNEANRVYTVKYGYNTMSQVVSIAYPGGKTIDLSNQNAFGHVLGIPGIANTLSYDAFGNLTSFQQGSIGWNRSYTADGRLQGITLSTPVGCHYNTSYQYDSLNRINKIVDNCNTNDAVSSITRWGTGQIKTVTGSIFSQQLGNTGTYSYAYDHDDIISITKTAGLSSPVTMTYAYQNAGASPRLDNITATPYVMSYDATGRVVSDGTSTFSYDGFGRLLGQADSQSSNQFFYAADNLRVAAKTTTGTAIQEIDYFYGLSGNLLYEINRTTQLAKHYVYAGGQLLATLESYPDTDSDNDGMADEEEIELGLNPMMAGDTTIDSDNDGLPDWQERLWGLNPHNPDTDGDGARDGYEYERLGLAAALDPARKPQQSEEAYRRCKGTKAPCWLIPVTSLLL